MDQTYYHQIDYILFAYLFITYSIVDFIMCIIGKSNRIRVRKEDEEIDCHRRR